MNKRKQQIHQCREKPDGCQLQGEWKIGEKVEGE